MYLNLTNNSSFNPEEYENNFCFFIENRFIPAYAFISSSYLKELEGFPYYLSITPQLNNNTMSTRNNITNIRRAVSGVYRVPVKIPISGHVTLIAFKGTILDTCGTPLFCYVFEHENLEFTEDSSILPFVKDPLKQKLLISSKLLTDSTYGSLYRRLQKEYLLSCYEKGIEVIVMSPENIQLNTFKKVEVKESCNFSSIESMQNYLTKVVPNLLNLEVEEIPQIENFELLPQVDVTPSVLNVEIREIETIPPYDLPIEEEALLFGGFDAYIEEHAEVEQEEEEDFDWNLEHVLPTITTIRQRGEQDVYLVED
jgi:hypothetical protein